MSYFFFVSIEMSFFLPQSPHNYLRVPTGFVLDSLLDLIFVLSVNCKQISEHYEYFPIGFPSKIGELRMLLKLQRPTFA